MDNPSAYNSNIYDSHIEHVLPYYAEYHKQVIDLVQVLGWEQPDWLDTGCGTGTLAAKVLSAIPGVRLTLCDPSEKMLSVAKQKLQGKDIRFLNIPSQALPFDQAFDVVTAIQSHHYLSPEERADAVSRCYQALRPSGIFMTFENIRMSTDESDAIALRRWVAFLQAHGNPPEDVEMQLARRGTEVLPITVEQHLELLRKCGFRSVNLLWASYLQAGFWAIR